MPGEPVDELRTLLTYKFLGYRELNGSEPEAARIDFLCEIVRGWEHGAQTLDDIKAAFRKYPVPDFDILLWMQSKADSGDYTSPIQ